MSLDDAVHVTEDMLDYCIGKIDTLDDTEATIDGVTAPFFTEREKSHLADCRELFMAGEPSTASRLIEDALAPLDRQGLYRDSESVAYRSFDNFTERVLYNRMSADDMFRLVCYLLRSYPEVTQITALKTAELASLKTSVYNTNPLLYNLPGVVGLKTGTTNMSGACLVTAMEAPDAEGRTHVLVSIEFGAEDSAARNTLSEELLRYGMQRLREDNFVPPRMPPADAETLIRRVLEAY
jgi:hypothetical protein